MQIIIPTVKNRLYKIKAAKKAKNSPEDLEIHYQ